MALFDEEQESMPPPENPIKVKAPPSRIEDKGFRGITIDTQYTPSSALLIWIAGSNWTVDYFSQVLHQDNEPTPQNLDRDPIYQQYRRIRGMDLKVTTPLSFSQNEEVLTMSATGSGIAYPFLVPNKGDMFIADVGDGTAGVFTITRAERATILRDSVYNIDYLMVSRLSPERLTDLERKTIKEYRYSRNSLVRGCGPFVTETQYTRAERYRGIQRELLSRYLTDFYSNQFQTLLVPDQGVTTYDHFVVKAFLKMVSHADHPDVRKVRELNVSAEPVMKQPTLWDAIVRRDVSKLYGCTQRVQLFTTTAFKGRVTLQALGFTGIRCVVFPSDAPTDIDAWYNGKAQRSIIGMNYTEGKPRRLPNYPLPPQMERGHLFFMRRDEVEEIPPWKVPADIHPVVKDDYYVLSEAFYQEDPAGMSKLELLVWQMVQAKALNMEQLDALLDSLWDWDNLERFYFYPLVWALLHVGTRSA
jgi:hypothetical protein